MGFLVCPVRGRGFRGCFHGRSGVRFVASCGRISTVRARAGSEQFAMTSQRTVYKVIFHNQGKVYEVYVRNVNQSGLLGFVEIGGFVFGEKSALVLDPTEEKLKSEFEGVKRAYIPMHAVVRIDEVEKEGINKILPGTSDSKVTPFPSPIFTPPKDSSS